MSICLVMSAGADRLQEDVLSKNSIFHRHGLLPALTSFLLSSAELLSKDDNIDSLINVVNTSLIVLIVRSVGRMLTEMT